MNAIKFAFVQSGYCVFGVGSTRQEAIADAQQWLEDSVTGKRGDMTVEEVTALVSNDRVDGGFRIIGHDNPEFDSYLRNQGGFEKRGDGWYAV